MRKIIRRGALGLALGGLMLGTSGCSLGYLLQQGQGQVSLLLRREPVERLVADPTLDAETREQLILVQDAKAFAENVLGLKRSESYTQIVRLDRDAVTYVVAGAPKDRLEPYLWWFPIVGNVPYKGYFAKADAEREKENLEKQGLDAYLRGVTAFSLLGIVPDPLYSPMLKASRAGLANVIIHELTHGTAFLAGKPSFNEGFATFVGDQGTRIFLSSHFGEDSAEVREAQALARDQARFAAVLDGLSRELRALYASRLARQEILARRDGLFARAKQELNGLPFETRGYQNLERLTLNNAYLVTHQTYHGNMQRFEQVYDRLGRDLRAFVSFFKDTVSKQKDPEGFLDAYLRAEPSSDGNPAPGSP